MTALLVALGGAVGAPLRFAIATWLDRGVPWGTLLVNVTGSFLLGLCAGWSLDGQALALVGTGFCGGFTTYSAFALQSARLGGWPAAGYAGATLALSLGACTAGFVLSG